MPDVKEIWEIINEKCRLLTDNLRITEFLDDKGIPPVIIPIAIIAIVLILALLLLGGTPATNCGDGICSSGEDETNCPEDCTSSVTPDKDSKTVTVYLEDTPDCEITTELRSPEGTILSSQRGTKSQFVFTGITEDAATVFVSGPYGKTYTSPQSALSDNQELSVTLPDDICKDAGAITNNAVLTVIVKDANTMSALQGVKISIAEEENDKPVSYAVNQKEIFGQRDFTVPGGKSYIIYAEKEGYDGIEQTISLTNTRKAITLSLKPQGASGTAATGEIEVCVKTNGQAISSALVTLSGVSDTSFVRTGTIDNTSTTSEAESGCYIFTDIPAGKLVMATASSAQDGCTQEASDTVIVPTETLSYVFIEMECDGDTAFLSIKVEDEDGNSLTDNATITLWTKAGKLLSGSGVAGALALGTDDYSENLRVPANTEIYALIKGLPDGYLDYTSEYTTLELGERKEETITLNYTSEGVSSTSENFSFSGFSSPKFFSPDEEFVATINEISFNSKKLYPEIAELKAYSGAQKCDILYDTKWRADCIAPSDLGEFELVFEIIYEGKRASQKTLLEVVEYSPNNRLLTVTPVYTTHGDPPLTLFYDIRLNGTPVDALEEQQISIEFLNSPDTYPGKVGNLTKVEGYDYWELSADVPFKGDYEITMDLLAESRGLFYQDTFVSGFSADSHSSKLSADISLSETMLLTGEDFMAEVILSFDGKTLPDIYDLELYLGGTFHGIFWNEARRVYEATVRAPGYEICSIPVSFYIFNEKIGNDIYIQVINTGLKAAATCPLDRSAACDNIEEVRKCLLNKKTKQTIYSDEQLKACISGGCGSGQTRVARDDSGNKGDLDADCQITEIDADIADSWLNTVGSDEGRLELVACLDINNDEIVDEKDTDCLTRLASGSWYGDIGEESDYGYCTVPMNGGFCFPLPMTSAIPGDFDSSRNIDDSDVETMQKIIDAINAGVTPAEDMLDFADFNQDGTIDESDLACLEGFQVADFTSGRIYKESGVVLDEDCINIFDLSCRGIKGDINDDAKITETDLVIINMIEQGMIRVSGPVKACADIDSDDDVDKIDIDCLNEYFKGDLEKWEICLDCDENLPDEAYSELEICGDGYDNNCDGLIDRDDPLCVCSASTPCEMYFDMDGGTSAGIDDGNYKVCRDVSWDQAGYKWMKEDEVACTKERGCGTYTCNDITMTCSSSGDEAGAWYSPGSLPGESCGDGWDNDCSGGDRECSTDSDDGGGCPFVYSYDGTDFVMEAAAFPIALAPAAETTSYSTLPSLRVSNGKLKVAVSQQLPEIAHLNTVKLFAVKHPKGTEVVPGVNGETYIISSPQKPISCTSRMGTDCKEELSYPEGIIYLHDLKNDLLVNTNDIDERILMTFDVPSGAKSATIIIKGKESGLLTFLWWGIYENLKTQSLGTFAVPILSSLESFLDKNGQVWVEYKKDGKWVLAGKKNLGYSLPGNGGKIAIPVECDGASLDIRLVFPISGFEIDYAAADFSGEKAAEVIEIDLDSAVRSDGQDALGELKNDDNEYVILHLGQWVEADFIAPQVTDGETISYIIAPKGYYENYFQIEFFGEDMDLLRIMLLGNYIYEYALENYVPNMAKFKEIYSPVEIDL